MLVAVAGMATFLSGCSAGLESRPLSDGVVSCGPGSPVVMLHQGDGRVAPSGHVTSPFTVEGGAYYLTMTNEYQMPPQDRQIALVRDQVVAPQIVACS